MGQYPIRKNIRKYRKAKGLRQQDLAEMVDISINYVGMIERGEKLPALETLIDIINALGVSADVILCDATDMGYQTKETLFSEKLQGLPRQERERIYDVVDVLVRHAKQRNG